MNSQNIERNISESDYRFNQRIDFIKKLEDKKYNLKEAIRLSKFWYNIKFNKCKYNKEIYQIIINLDPKLKINS